MNVNKYYLNEMIETVKVSKVRASIAVLITSINEARNRKPESKSVKRMAECILEIHGIVEAFINDRESYHEALRIIREAKNEEILKMREEIGDSLDVETATKKGLEALTEKK